MLIKPKKALAFTLAEVLITLGIIGIISLFTIPTLLHNIQERVLINQFKSTYSILLQALTKTVSYNDNIPYECYSSYSYNYSWSECGNFWIEYLKNLKIIRDVNVKPDGINFPDYTGVDLISAKGGTILNGSCSIGKEVNKPYLARTVYLVNGSIMRVWNTSSFFMVDINGLKPPNKWGYDLFILTFIKRDRNSSVVVNDRLCGAIEKGGFWVNDILQGK